MLFTQFDSQCDPIPSSTNTCPTRPLQTKYLPNLVHIPMCTKHISTMQVDRPLATHTHTQLANAPTSVSLSLVKNQVTCTMVKFQPIQPEVRDLISRVLVQNCNRFNTALTGTVLFPMCFTCRPVLKTIAYRAAVISLLANISVQAYAN